MRVTFFPNGPWRAVLFVSRKTTETNFSLGEGGYMEVQDVVGFKEVTETVKRAAPVAAKPKAKSVSLSLSSAGLHSFSGSLGTGPWH